MASAGRAEGAESDIAAALLTREMCALVKKGVKSPKKAFKATFVVKVEKELLLCYSLQHWLGTKSGRGGSEAHMPQPPPQRSVVLHTLLKNWPISPLSHI